MNRYLLDTHILIWWLYDHPNLASIFRDCIADPNNEIVVSVASMWEIEIKRNLGKLTIDENYFQAIEEEDFTILPIFASHTLALRNLPDIHKDPFDRILIAQAQCEKLTIMTQDAIIPRYPVATFTPPRTL